jgi:hypothetical protein
MVSIILRHSEAFRVPRKSQFRSLERNGTEWNSAEKIIPSPYTGLDSDEESEEDEEDEKDDVNIEERKDESEFSESEEDDGLLVTSPSSGSHKEPTSYVEDRTLSRYWFCIYLLYIYVGGHRLRKVH